MKSAVLTVVGMLLAAAAGSAQEIPAYTAGGPITMPTVVSEVKPAYTADAVRARLQGLVKMAVVVNADGTVGDVRVVQPLDPQLDAQAIAAMKQWRFKPGMKGDVAVPVRVEVEMTFTLRDTPGPRVGSPEALKPGNGVGTPKVISEVKPDYPPAIMVKGVKGSVVMDCVVLPDGGVGDIRVTQSLEPSLDAAAVRALRKWRFEPGTKDGKAVPVQVSIEMTFTVRP